MTLLLLYRSSVHLPPSPLLSHIQQELCVPVHILEPMHSHVMYLLRREGSG